MTMNHRINQIDPPEQHPDTVWDQVVGVVGPAFLQRLDPDMLAEFQALIANASTLGRDAHAPVREVPTLVGDRWTTLVLHLLHFGTLRFSVLQRLIKAVDEVGISRRMLSLNLRALERDGLVARKVITTLPPNVEYSLTPLGQQLWQHVFSLVTWLGANTENILAARAAFGQKDQEP